MLSKTFERTITVNGTSDIMFDRYNGTESKLPVEKKFYSFPDGTLYFPALNIFSFLTSEHTKSAPKILCESKKFKVITSAFASSTNITPIRIPFLRNGKPIKFKEFVENADGVLVDEKSGMRVEFHAPRVDGGIPHDQRRPVLPMPWSLTFKLMVTPHEALSEEFIEDIFERGGQRVGFGTFRPFYGRFAVEWK